MRRAASAAFVKEALRVLLGIVLFILVTGIRVCLWVPPPV